MNNPFEATIGKVVQQLSTRRLGHIVGFGMDGAQNLVVLVRFADQEPLDNPEGCFLSDLFS